MDSKVFKVINTPENQKRLELFIDWCNFLCEHKEEAMETLEEENLIQESIKLHYGGSQQHLLCERKVSVGESLKQSNQERPLNRVHKKLWQQLEKELSELPVKSDRVEVLYDFRF